MKEAKSQFNQRNSLRSAAIRSANGVEGIIIHKNKKKISIVKLRLSIVCLSHN